MVWIHGGAFEVGGTVEPREEGTNFVKENPDVILVFIEYRLGVFGFFHLSHLPDGADYPDAQNLGLMDQMMALKWIHNNIEAFGGDPGNVTIFGESAGAASCSMLPMPTVLLRTWRFLWVATRTRWTSSSPVSDRKAGTSGLLSARRRNSTSCLPTRKRW